MSKWEHKNCEYCNKIFPRLYHESPSRFAEKRFCSIRCSGLAQGYGVRARTKLCQQCWNEFHPRHFPTRIEEPNAFNRRKFCSKLCATAARVRAIDGRFTPRIFCEAAE